MFTSCIHYFIFVEMLTHFPLQKKSAMYADNIESRTLKALCMGWEMWCSKRVSYENIKIRYMRIKICM